MKTIFTSRKFWAAIIGLVLVIVAAWLPSFNLDREALVGFVVITASYIVGVAVDPGPGGWRGVLQSRKFWAATVGAALIILHASGVKLPFELSADQLTAICVTIGGYIAGVAIEGKSLARVSLTKASLTKASLTLPSPEGRGNEEKKGMA
jgi:uncharacterized membrane protein